MFCWSKNKTYLKPAFLEVEAICNKDKRLFFIRECTIFQQVGKQPVKKEKSLRKQNGGKRENLARKIALKTVETHRNFVFSSFAHHLSDIFLPFS